MSELTQLQVPLVKESDVAGLTMGARSKEKVLEIIQTGTLRRNEMMADDQEQQTIQLVTAFAAMHANTLDAIGDCCHVHCSGLGMARHRNVMQSLCQSQLALKSQMLPFVLAAILLSALLVGLTA